MCLCDATKHKLTSLKRLRALEMDDVSIMVTTKSMIGSVGTLNQGYPLLRYEGAAPVPHLQVIRRAAPDPTTWAGLGAPRGKERQYFPRWIDGSGPPRDAGPLYERVQSPRRTSWVPRISSRLP